MKDEYRVTYRFKDMFGNAHSGAFNLPAESEEDAIRKFNNVYQGSLEVISVEKFEGSFEYLNWI